MPAIARNQPSNCLNPILDVFTYQNGLFVDVYSLSFQIWERVSDPNVPVQVYPLPAGTKQTVNVGQLCPTGHHLDTGHYVGEWTPPISELLGTHQIRWYFKLTPSSPEQLYTEEFEVLAEATASGEDGYCTIADLRDEGVTIAMLSDARASKLIQRYSRFVDRETGRFFSPRLITMIVDGRGGRTLHLGDPIIAVQTLDFIYDSVSSSQSPIDINLVKVYNRHVTQHADTVDDRENPRLEFIHESDLLGVPQVALYSGINFRNLVWPKGPQTIRIAGLFGYTEYDGSLYGKTPDEIREVTMRLVIKNMKPLAQTVGVPVPAGLIKREKTRDQEVEYTNLSGDAGKSYRFAGITGDPEIDGVLLAFRRPPGIRGV